MSGTAGTSEQKVIVETTHGHVRGEARPGHVRFRGIPFAAPPTGALRFAAPAPAEPWKGVRDCLDYSASSIQPPSMLPGMTVGAQSEDCLYLNVFTPATDDARRPVLFWIHGGGFTGGGACQPLYEGEPIVVRGDIVLVTINYRLGALGYLALEGLDGATANAGQLDQIAALEWVRANIERFGGDPGNVTIFGESAGGMAVTTLLGMPAARGLFHKAIAQSGAAAATLDEASAAKTGDIFLECLGVDPTRIDEVRSKSAEEILKAQLATLARLRRSGTFLVNAPTIDGRTLPVHPLEAVKTGQAADIPLMTGTTLDEWRLFEMPSLMKDFDRASLDRRLERTLPTGADIDGLVGRYAEARGEDPADPRDVRFLYSAIQTDRIFRIPAIRLAEAQALHRRDTFMYLFSWPSPARRGELGACHAIELPFVFGTLSAPGMDRFAGAGDAAEALSLRTMDAWLAFARSGDPGHEDLPTWTAYDGSRRSTLRLDREDASVDAPMDAERAAWDAIA